MKKIVLAAAFVLAATMVHAAACTWSLAGITDSNTTKVAKDSMVAFFMDGATYEEFTGLTGIDKIASYVNSNAKSSAKTAVARTGAQAGTTFGAFDPGTEISSYIVIFDSSDPASAVNYAYTSPTTAKVPGSGALSISKAFGSDTATKGWVAIPTGSTPGGVPEPTSGLLLVLGGAALALRRRR